MQPIRVGIYQILEDESQKKKAKKKEREIWVHGCALLRNSDQKDKPYIIWSEIPEKTAALTAPPPAVITPYDDMKSDRRSWYFRSNNIMSRGQVFGQSERLPAGLWVSYKGDPFFVFGILEQYCFSEPKKKMPRMVVYQEMFGLGAIYTRLESEFSGKKEVKGENVPRFEFVSSNQNLDDGIAEHLVRKYLADKLNNVV